MRQAENLSPTLFSLILNDTEEFLKTNHCTGINFDFDNNQFTVFLKLLDQQFGTIVCR